MSAASASFQAGTWLVLRRVGRRHAMGITAAAVAFAAIASYAERKAVVSDAASRALQGPGFGLALPIAAFAVLSCSLGRGRLEAGVSPAAALGAHRRLAALGALVGAAVVAAAIGALIACVTALAGHGPPSAASISDALTSSWIGALTAACYAFYFGAGASFGAQGGGRVIALGLDLFIGPLATPVAVLFPRAHALNLLGRPEAVPGWSQAASTIGLVSLACFFALMAVRRTPD